MKNTRENLLKLLKAQDENHISCYHIYKDENNKKEEDKNFWQHITVDSIVRMIEDENYFNTMWEIYFKEEKKNG